MSDREELPFGLLGAIVELGAVGPGLDEEGLLKGVAAVIVAGEVPDRFFAVVAHPHQIGLAEGIALPAGRRGEVAGLEQTIGRDGCGQGLEMVHFTVAPPFRLGGEAAGEEGDNHDSRNDKEQGAFEKLDVGGRSHAGGGDDDRHDHADDADADPVRHAEERLDQHPGADHLRDQVEDRDAEGGDRRHQLDPLGVELGVESVGEGVLAETFHRLGNEEEGDHPARQVANGVHPAIEAGGGDHAADAEERSGGEIVAGEGDAVGEPVDVAAGGIVAGRGGGAAGEVEGEAEDEGDETEEEADGQRRSMVNHGRRPLTCSDALLQHCRASCR